MNGITVIICCYNSETRIIPTLQHLANQDFHLPFEIILVDNNCKDNTVSTAENFWQIHGYSVPLHIARETTPGLSHARTKGTQEASFDLLIFCDDDNWLAPNYLRRAYEIMTLNSNIGILGGRSEAVTETAPPAWFESESPNYAVGSQSHTSGDVKDRLFVWGAGMVLRKWPLVFLLENGISTQLTDRKGNQLSSGGDGEVCAWYRAMGFEIHYHPDLFFKHFISSDRLTKDYIERLYQGFNEASGLILSYKKLLFPELRPELRKRLSILKRSLISKLTGSQAPSTLEIEWALPIVFLSNKSARRKALKQYRRIKELVERRVS